MSNLSQSKPINKDETRPGQDEAERVQKPQPIEKESLEAYIERMNAELFG